MGLLETVLATLVKTGGEKALTKLTKEIEKKADSEERADKRLLGNELSSVIVKSIINGDSIDGEPLRPMIKRFRSLLEEGVRIRDADATLRLIQRAEVSDAAGQRPLRPRDGTVMWMRSASSPGGTFSHVEGARLPTAKKAAAKKAVVKKAVGKKAVAKSGARKTPAVKKFGTKLPSGRDGVLPR